MTAFVVGVLVLSAVAGPTWLDLARSRNVARRLELPIRPVPGRGPRGCSPSTFAQILAADRGLARVGRPLRCRAGRPPDSAADAAVGLAVTLGVLAAVLAGPAMALPVVTVVVAVPALRSRSARHRGERDVRRALPDVVDLFRLAAGAGMSVHQAVAIVAERSPDPVGPVLRSAARRAGMGERLGDALDALEVLGEPGRPLRAALTSAARYGSPLGPTLERVADDARMLRRREAEERARRLPVQLLFPLVACVLPAFGLLAVVPLLAGSLPALSDIR
jgi:tight adherence protein C